MERESGVGPVAGHHAQRPPRAGRAGDQPTWSGPVAGVAAGVAGLAVFLVLHAVWIVPIWGVVGLGLVVAALGGAAAGWALSYVRHRLPRRLPAAWLAVTAGVVLVLTPSVVLTVAIGSPVTVVDGVALVPTAADIPRLAVRFVVELLLVSALSGVVLGWWLTRRRRGALATGVAALLFALGPGHNNPFILFTGVPGATRTGLLIQLAAIATASAVLVSIDRVVGGRAPAAE